MKDKITIKIGNKDYTFIKNQPTRLWLIGYSGSGKSTLAVELSRGLGVPVLEAGRFARAIHGKGGAAELSEFTKKMLQSDLRYFSDLIKEHIRRGSYIVVGVRNPVDFADSFNPLSDYVLVLDAGKEPKSGFEKFGIEAIRAFLDFLLEMRVFDPARLIALRAKTDKEDWFEVSAVPYHRSCHDW